MSSQTTETSCHHAEAAAWLALQCFQPFTHLLVYTAASRVFRWLNVCIALSGS